ncbi:MAG: histidine phosphatase family protein [Actinomycetota bacterium]|nr:histidine phosphatase family protein [Actinomycetota bacterium]MDQ2957363.1 histidine phosphatase family protein [Actinomycetota bacterium]
MPIEIVFETHSWSEDNDRGFATGWLPGALSGRGKQLARELGDRRREDRLAAIFSSDLRRAVQTAEIALGDTDLPLLLDWRLRECDYGTLNGAPASQVHADRQQRLGTPFPGGESWQQAVDRVGGFLRDLPSRWAGQRVLVIGHVATRWAFDHVIDGATLAELSRADFGWQEGWEYKI